MLGSKNGATECINITILDDNFIEEDENFTISLTSSDARALIRRDVTLVTILDNDGNFLNHCIIMHYYYVGVIIYLPSMLSVNEYDGFVQVCATLSTTRLTTGRRFTIHFATNDSSGISF